MEEKRYYVTVTKVIYARNDNEACVKSAQFAEKTESVVNELIYLPFASLESRLVHKGTLTLFDNRIIERI